MICRRCQEETSSSFCCDCCGDDPMGKPLPPVYPDGWWVFSNGRAIYFELTEERARKVAAEWVQTMIDRGAPTAPRMQLEFTKVPPAALDGRGGWVPGPNAIDL